MIISDNINKIIEKKIGADINLLGVKNVESAILNGIKKSKAKSIEEYGILLQIDNNIYNSFVEEIIIPKTWFFRNKDSYIYLKNEIIGKWKTEENRVLRVLSIPCSTGEEPYSIASTLFEAGLNKSNFTIDAMDISNNAISFANCGIYPKNHTQIEDVSFINQYIFENGENIYVDDQLKSQISFINANLLDINSLNKKKYDIIFCRNVFIYFTKKAREKVILNLKNLLIKGGLIFTGHAELNIFLNSGFIKTGTKNSFVCSVGKKKKKELKKKKKRELKINIKKAIISKEQINIEKEPTVLTYQMIKSLADIGEYQKAMLLCETYIEEMKPDAEIFYIKGLIHQLQNSMDNAQVNFEKAIYLKPDYYDALLQMSFLMEKKGKLKSAVLFKNRAKRSYKLTGE